MEFVIRIANSFAVRYRGLSPAARVATAVLGLAVVLGMATVWNWRGASASTLLFGGQTFAASRLPAMEAAFAKAGLNDYEIESNRIRVPQARQSAYIGALAEAGALPKEFNVGMIDAATRSGPFTSRPEREAMQRAAKQSELQSIIMAMRGIEAASVIYDVQESASFGQPRAITASVSVKPIGTQQLEEDRVPIVRNLVAGAIAGLKPENVTVIDLNGRNFSAGTSGGASTVAANGYASLKARYERDWQTKISAALGFIPGSIVTVNVELDHDGHRATPGAELAPKHVAVTVAIPSSYYETVWREQHSSAPAESALPDDARALGQIESKVKADVEQSVLALLPSGSVPENGLSRVTVTSFQHSIAPRVTPLGDRATAWLGEHGGIAGIAVGTIVGGTLMIWMWRAGANARRVRAPSAAPADLPTTRDESTWDRPSRPVPVIETATPWVRDELRQLVHRNPNAAVTVLRNWIGNAS